MPGYTERVLPRLIDLALGSGVDPMRARVTQQLDGEVLEVGFGSGRNLPHLPAGVTRLLAVEPASGARKLAAGRIAARGLPVEYVGVDGAHLDVPDASVDHVLSTWTLCTIPDVTAALAEIRRVLRPGGQLHFIEHGRSPHAAVARWQRRLTTPWQVVAGGCQLDRRIDALVEAAGLELVALESYRLSRPEAFGWTYEGVARKAA